ncbi:MAG: hypothetical protein ACUBOA_07935 [Candidatus Loosdrechtia sp.]|uniref:hypothetical protein n=1 Tax=Candidatus Loosdrechtia sp. TaxID=3101272 RepID=UPI003A7171B4|nr:MAG: hypothetical protein QY305_15145 [Candidatus Jettenia sp. AMX2]
MNPGRFVQIIGIIIALYALYFGMVKDSMKMEILMLFIGVSVFYCGRILENKK